MPQAKIWQGLSRWDLVLGSQSPRRAELLRGLGLSFRTLPLPDLDESFPLELPAHEVAPYLSRKKAEAYTPLMDERTLLITSDTTVIVGDSILNKPADREEARHMLRQLSGRAHEVVTGLSLCTLGHCQTVGERTLVHFAELSEAEIDYYIDAYQPYDKAGAYGIQEWIGYYAIERIEGSFYSVMGLPTHRLVGLLKHFCQE